MNLPAVSLRFVCAVAILHSLAMLSGGSSLHAQAPGTVDPVFGGASLGLTTNVRVLARQPDGKVLVGGTFERGLVRLGADGSLDTGFNAAIAPSIGVLVLQPDGKIVIGVDPSYQKDGVSYPSVTRLNADGSLDTAFQPATNESVRALALQPDGKIVVSYQYDLARLNADGSPDTGFQASSLDTGADVIVSQPDGKIVVGGDFYTVINGVYQAGPARLNADGSLDAGFHAEINGSDYVSALALQPDGKIIVGGDFTQVDGVSHNNLVRLNTDGSLDAGFQAGTDSDSNITVSALALQPDGEILVGGRFLQFNGGIHPVLARLNTDGSPDAGFQESVNGGDFVYALVVQPDGEILAGGGFTQINGVGTDSVVRLTAGGQIDHSFNPDTASGPNAVVSALALRPDGKVVIGGGFTQVNGVSHIGLAQLKADGSLDASFQASTDGTVSALALQPDGKILVGGDFTQVNGVSQNVLARLAADGSLDTSFQAGIGSGSEALAVALQPDGKMIVGGILWLGQGDTTYQRGLVRLNADGSLDASFQAGIESGTDVNALALQPDGKIVLGFARLNPDGSLDVSFADAGLGEQSPLALQPDGKILIGTDGKIVRFNADCSPDASFSAATDDHVSTLALQSDGRIVVGGRFTQVNGIGWNNLARLNADGSLDPFFNPGGSGPNQPVETLALQPDGKILVGGEFTGIDEVLRDHVARLGGGGAPDLFGAGAAVGGGFYYEQFPGGNVFGYYNLSGDGYSFPYFFHADLGMEYFFDAQDGRGGAYLYDFASGGFFYTSPSFPWPYLYDFTLNTVLYYYPDPNNAGHYNTNGYRFFYRFDTGQIIVK